jgi:hypothetical protein
VNVLPELPNRILVPLVVEYPVTYTFPEKSVIIDRASSAPPPSIHCNHWGTPEEFSFAIKAAALVVLGFVNVLPELPNRMLVPVVLEYPLTYTFPEESVVTDHGCSVVLVPSIHCSHWGTPEEFSFPIKAA